jgi:N-acetylglutamate synthase/N-acetylornithine aminotransferase
MVNGCSLLVQARAVLINAGQANAATVRCGSSQLRIPAEKSCIAPNKRLMLLYDEYDEL